MTWFLLGKTKLVIIIKNYNTATHINSQRFTFPMHFSKWGANLPATIGLPQFMQSNTSFATLGCVCPNMSTTYLPLVSPLLLGSATVTRACADSLNSSSSSSKLRSRPNLAIRWHSEATSTIMESRSSPKKWDESCNQNIYNHEKHIIELYMSKHIKRAYMRRAK